MRSEGFGGAAVAQGKGGAAAADDIPSQGSGGRPSSHKPPAETGTGGAGGAGGEEKADARTEPLLPADAALAADAEAPADVAPAPDAAVPEDVLPPAADTAPAPEPLDPSLVAWWKFDEPKGSTMAEDSSGHGNHGQLQNLNPDAAWIDGHFGGALLVSDQTQMGRNGAAVVVAASPSLEGLSRRFTFAAWIRRAVVRTRDPRAIISRSAGGRMDLFWVGLDEDQLTINGNKLGWAWAVPETLTSTAQWGHVAVAVDSGTARVYVDGRTVNMRDRLHQGGDIQPGARNDLPIVIGGSMADGALQELFQGAIDDLRVYDRALSADEIRALAQQN